MNRVVIFVFCVALSAFSCDDAFDPHGEFVERPVLYCVMKAPAFGLSYQRAMLTRTVPGREMLVSPDGFSSPFISGAQIILRAGIQDIVLQESLDTLHIGTPEQLIQLMYEAPAVPLRPTDGISIQALLPDGRILSASTTVPSYLYFELSYQFPHGFTTDVNPLTRGTVWTFRWNAPNGMLHFPELSLIYRVLRTDSSTAYRMHRIPQQFLSVSGSEIPAYPQPTYEQSCGFEFAAIDSVFARLGREEGEYLQLAIQSMRFSVVTFDVHLGRFYTSVHGTLDPYSIRIDQTLYSNINGGIGIFGTYVESTLEIDVDQQYIESCGFVKD
jgi:hypothetical protein